MTKDINELLRWKPLINMLKDKCPLTTSNGYDVYDIGLDDIGYCYDDRIVRVNCTLESRTFREPFIVQLYINLELLTRLSRVPGELLEFHHIYRTTYQLMEKHIGTQILNNL